MSIHQDIFNQLLKVVPAINTDAQSGKSKSESFMDLNFDLLNEDDTKQVKVIALSHYYKHDSGDMIPDPDMTMIVHFADKNVYALSYQDVYRYDEIDPDSPESLKESLNEFLLQWLCNLEEQGHVIR